MNISPHRAFVVGLGMMAALAACDSRGASQDSPSAPASAADEKTSETPPARDAKKGEGDTAPAAAAPAVELVTHELDEADPSWAGWTAQAPKDAKVMQDGVKGARLASKGPNMLERREGKVGGFDIAFAWKKSDLKNLKANLEKGAEASKGEMKLDFTKEEADALEWTSEGYGETKYNFVVHMTVDGNDVTCKNNYMVGIDTEELRKQHLEACRTLAKK